MGGRSHATGGFCCVLMESRHAGAPRHELELLSHGMQNFRSCPCWHKAVRDVELRIVQSTFCLALGCPHSQQPPPALGVNPCIVDIALGSCAWLAMQTKTEC